MTKITCLMEDRKSARRGIESEHGFSLLIERGGKKYIFDTGSSGLFLKNAEALGLDLADNDAVIISHFHYDHAGGLAPLIKKCPDTHALYTGPDFFDRKYSWRGGIKLTDLSGGFSSETLRLNGIFHHEVGDMTKLAEGMWLMSNFERTHEKETIPDRFIRETGKGFEHDDFRDEVALAIETEKGIVLIVGCSHPGILNIASTVSKRLGKKLYAVIGGTHLVEADDSRIEETVSELVTLGVEVLALCHCSGEKAESLIEEKWSDMYTHIAPADVLFFA